MSFLPLLVCTGYQKKKIKTQQEDPFNLILFIKTAKDQTAKQANFANTGYFLDARSLARPF